MLYPLNGVINNDFFSKTELMNVKIIKEDFDFPLVSPPLIDF